MTTLRDPEECPRGHVSVRVIDSRKRKGYRRRMYRCRICGIKWPAFLSLINPKELQHQRQPST